MNDLPHAGDGPPAPREPGVAFRQAIALHRSGEASQADAICAELLRINSGHADAWHLRGLIAIAAGQTELGIERLHRSIAIAPTQPVFHSNLGNALLDSRRPRDALASLDRALELRPEFPTALYNRGNALRLLGRLPEAVESYDRVLFLMPTHALSHCNRGVTLFELGQTQEALEALERATELNPNLPQVHENLGGVLIRLERPADALAYYDALVQRLPASVEGLCGRGNVLMALNRHADAIETYESAVRLAPQYGKAHVGLGRVLQILHRWAEANSAYERGLRAEPDSAVLRRLVGEAYLGQNRPEAALPLFARSLELRPDQIGALYGRGAALRELKRFEEAAESFRRVIRIGADAPERNLAIGNLFELEATCCDWSAYDERLDQVREVLERRRVFANPLVPLLLPDAGALARRSAEKFVTDRYPPKLSSGASGGESTPRVGTASGRIRVAYVSSDFRDHPVSFLLAGVLERHDRSQFEVIGLSLRPPDTESAIGRRVRSAFDRCIEVEEHSDDEAAQALRDLGVDVAVDLMGLTQGLRLGIFARRAAPVQVNYLGYAGTLGAPFIDYIVGDQVTIPAGDEVHYTEQVVRLPHCFLPNDDRRDIAPESPNRAQLGLPETGIVYCAFSSSFKINPKMFDVWMAVLREVPGSVLWLRSGPELALGNLRHEAQRRGVSPERLVFATHVAEMSEHLARHRRADLYLDTLPYGAHSTTCDALWAGVPVLTCAGRSFAGRVAASALQTLGLQELIAENLEEYARYAVELGRAPEKLRLLRERLVVQRSKGPLFDTATYTRALEAAYRQMHERARRGEAAAAFDVAPEATGRV